MIHLNSAGQTKQTALAISLAPGSDEMCSLLLSKRPATALNQSTAIFCSPESKATVRTLITITRRRHLAVRGCRSLEMRWYYARIYKHQCRIRLKICAQNYFIRWSVTGNCVVRTILSALADIAKIIHHWVSVILIRLQCKLSKSVIVLRTSKAH